MKQIIDLRPVYYRLEQRIRIEFDLLTVATFTGLTGTFRQRAELTKPQRDILAKLGIPTPEKIVDHPRRRRLTRHNTRA